LQPVERQKAKGKNQKAKVWISHGVGHLIGNAEQEFIFAFCLLLFAFYESGIS
jgi:hypothetical protein